MKEQKDSNIIYVSGKVGAMIRQAIKDKKERMSNLIKSIQKDDTNESESTTYIQGYDPRA